MICFAQVPLNLTGVRAATQPVLLTSAVNYSHIEPTLLEPHLPSQPRQNQQQQQSASVEGRFIFIVYCAAILISHITGLARLSVCLTRDVRNPLKLSFFLFSTNQTKRTSNFEYRKVGFHGMVFRKPNCQFLDSFCSFMSVIELWLHCV